MCSASAEITKGSPLKTGTRQSVSSETRSIKDEIHMNRVRCPIFGDTGHDL